MGRMTALVRGHGMRAGLKRSAGAALALCGSLIAFTTPAAPLPLDEAPGVQLIWEPTATTGRRPVVVALHGCGGLYTRGVLDARYQEYAARWKAAGWHVLLPDSFTGRGKSSICRESNESRSVTVAMRRDDVNAALAWLARRTDVDAGRIALVGWSNGGSTVLRTIDRPGWSTAPVAAIALYPSCARALRSEGFAPAVPLLLLAGALDDWTPSQPCVDLVRRVAERARGAQVEIVVYADSVHGFDDSRPVRQRTDISTGVDPRGVHVGGNPAARADTLARSDQFLKRYLD